jgi:hypothetical protein
MVPGIFGTEFSEQNFWNGISVLIYFVYLVFN